MRKIYFGDNLPILRDLPSGLADLVYIDPPFNTGGWQTRTRLRTVRDDNGDRVGFQGKRYRSEQLSRSQFRDQFDDFLAFLEPRLIEIKRILSDSGSLYFHIDYREVHYCKILLDQIFGRDCFLNEIIWAYDYGGRPKRRWPAKHDNILLYVKDPQRYTFNRDDIDRIPYMAPGLVGPEKAVKGKLPTDTWWHTIVAPGSKERTGYPTQKPEPLIERIVRASSSAGSVVLDCFAGSGTTGAVCARLDRGFVLIDNNAEAIRVMRRRLPGDTELIGGAPSDFEAAPAPGAQAARA